MREFALKVNEDKLIGHAWEVKDPIANVVIFQGMEEYGLRYDHFAKFLNQNCINAYALDCYGQGSNVKSDFSNESFWPEDGFFKMVDAHYCMVEEAKKNGAKTYVFAHSMGSFMGQMFIQKHPGAVDKIVLCGTGSKKPGMGLAVMLAKRVGTGKKRFQKAKFLNKMMFGSFNKKIKNPKTDYDWLSYNAENVEKYVNDPLCGFGPTNGFCYQFLKGLKAMYTLDGLNKIDKNQSVFLISGDADPVTNYGKSTQKMFDLYKNLGLKKVEKKIYSQARHELIFEACRDEVYKDILDYLLG